MLQSTPGTSPQTQSRPANNLLVPWFTVSLIGINVLVAFGLLFRPGLEQQFGFFAARPSAISAFTSLFLHANVLHLLGNMLFLAAVGPLIEFSKGPQRFALIYFAGGFAGILGHWILMSHNPASPPLMGASASIAACVAYVSVAYIRKRVPIAPGIGVPVGVIAVVWVVLQALGGWVRIGDDAGGGVAFWAHLSGFLAGLVVSALFGVSKDQSMQLGHEVLDRMNDHGPAAVLAAADVHLAKHPQDRKAMRERAKSLEELNRKEEACSAYLNLAEVAPEADQPELITKLDRLGGLKLLPSFRRIQWADEVKPISRPAADLLLQSVVDEHDSDPKKPDALYNLAHLVKEADPDRSTELLDELQAKYSLHDVTEHARQKGLLK